MQGECKLELIFLALKKSIWKGFKISEKWTTAQEIKSSTTFWLFWFSAQSNFLVDFSLFGLFWTFLAFLYIFSNATYFNFCLTETETFVRKRINLWAFLRVKSTQASNFYGKSINCVVLLLNHQLQLNGSYPLFSQWELKALLLVLTLNKHDEAKQEAPKCWNLTCFWFKTFPDFLNFPALL